MDEWPYENFFAIEEKCSHPLCTVGFSAGGPTWKGDRGCKRPTGNKTFGGICIGPLSDFEWALSPVTQLGKGDRGCKRPTGNKTFGLPRSFLTASHSRSPRTTWSRAKVEAPCSRALWLWRPLLWALLSFFNLSKLLFQDGQEHDVEEEPDNR